MVGHIIIGLIPTPPSSELDKVYHGSSAAPGSPPLSRAGKQKNAFLRWSRRPDAMTSVSWDDEKEEEVKASAVRWKGRTLVNFAVGRSRVRALPVVIHFLPEDTDWFSSVSWPRAGCLDEHKREIFPLFFVWFGSSPSTCRWLAVHRQQAGISGFSTMVVRCRESRPGTLLSPQRYRVHGVLN